MVSAETVVALLNYSLARALVGARAAGAAAALLPKRRAHPTATFELGDQAIKGRFRRSKFLIPVANASTGGA